MMRSGRPDCAIFSRSGTIVLHRRELLFVDEDVRLFEVTHHLVLVRDEVRREVTLVELHPFDPVDGRVEALALFDGDDAVLADLLHRLGDHLADLRIVVRRDRRDLGDFGVILDLLRKSAELFDDRTHRAVDATLERDRVRAGGHVLETFVVDRFGEDRCGGRPVARGVAGLRRDFLHHLGAHVLVGVLELDLLRDRDTVLGDRRRAEALFENHVPPARAERDLDRARQFLDAAPDRIASFVFKSDFLGTHAADSSWGFEIRAITRSRDRDRSHLDFVGSVRATAAERSARRLTARGIRENRRVAGDVTSPGLPHPITARTSSSLMMRYSSPSTLSASLP